ncbi:hypothetical protein BH10PSE6_BH10PSE6_36120 [soil metagenome]
MVINVPTIDEMATGIRRGVAVAIKDAHGRGLPVFVSDDKLIYAIYPDGRHVAVERLSDDIQVE